MGQVTIYLDDDSERRLKAAARAEGLSVSRWVATAVGERIRDEWPQSVRALAGTWDDFPEAEELRHNAGTDTAREPL